MIFPNLQLQNQTQISILKTVMIGASRRATSLNVEGSNLQGKNVV
jgi:hypothetical protein